MRCENLELLYHCIGGSTDVVDKHVKATVVPVNEVWQTRVDGLRSRDPASTQKQQSLIFNRFGKSRRPRSERHSMSSRQGRLTSLVPVRADAANCDSAACVVLREVVVCVAKAPLQTCVVPQRSAMRACTSTKPPTH